MKISYTELNLYSVWSDFRVDFTYMSEKEDGNYTSSTIDHFVSLGKFRNKIIEAGVIHSIENLSDHELIYAVVNTTDGHIKKEKTMICSTVQKPIWKNASCDQKLEFNDVMFRKLRNLVVNDDLIS